MFAPQQPKPLWWQASSSRTPSSVSSSSLPPLQVLFLIGFLDSMRTWALSLSLLHKHTYFFPLTLSLTQTCHFSPFTLSRTYLHTLSHTHAHTKTLSLFSSISFTFPLSSSQTHTHTNSDTRRTAHLYSHLFLSFESLIFLSFTSYQVNQCKWVNLWNFLFFSSILIIIGLCLLSFVTLLLHSYIDSFVSSRWFIYWSCIM